jgi:glycosyltransferase involved in cell wall biosynthesis
MHRFPAVKTHWLPNGIDPERFLNFERSDWRVTNGFTAEDFILLYAGIIGYAQGLDCILEAADILKTYQSIKFVLIGEGPEKERLMMKSSNLNLTNLHFFNSVNAVKMPGIISEIDASIVPLKNLELFRGAIPSKIFENLAMKKPVILGVDGEARKIFIDQGNCGLFFRPEDFKDLSEKILMLYNDRSLAQRLGINGELFVNRFFDRRKIAGEFLSAINFN